MESTALWRGRGTPVEPSSTRLVQALGAADQQLLERHQALLRGRIRPGLVLRRRIERVQVTSGVQANVTPAD